MATTTTTAGGKGKASKGKASKGKASKAAVCTAYTGTFKFRGKKGSAHGAEHGSLKVGEFGKVRLADVKPSAMKLLVLSTLVNKCKGEGSPAEVRAACPAIPDKRGARHYLYHAEAGGLVKRLEGTDCKGSARYAITAAGRKAVKEMQAMKFETKAKVGKGKASKATTAA